MGGILSWENRKAVQLARQYGCQIVAIDISPDMVKAARQRVKKEGSEHLIDCRQADAHHLPFTDESFDVVFLECVSVLPDVVFSFTRELCAKTVWMVFSHIPANRNKIRLDFRWRNPTLPSYAQRSFLLRATHGPCRARASARF